MVIGRPADNADMPLNFRARLLSTCRVILLAGFAAAFDGCGGGGGLAQLPPVTPQQAATVSKAVKATTFYVQLHPADAPNRALLQTLHDQWHAGGIRMDYIVGNFAFYDALIADANAVGMKLDLITPYGTADSTPASYAAAVATAAQRYAGNSITWEIYNEPNLNFPSSLGSGLDGYVALAKSTALAIRAADKSATIITGGTGGNDTKDFSFAIAAGKALAPYVDGVSIHPYSIDYDSFGSAIVEVNAATGLTGIHLRVGRQQPNRPPRGHAERSRTLRRCSACTSIKSNRTKSPAATRIGVSKTARGKHSRRERSSSGCRFSRVLSLSAARRLPAGLRDRRRRANHRYLDPAA